MKLINKVLFMCILVCGLSVAAMAQRGDDKQKPPPKGGSPPVVVPREKPPRDNPKGGDKPKKPGMAAVGKAREEDVV